MKITLLKIYGAFDAIHKIKAQKLGFQIDYWCMRNIKALHDHVQFLIMERSQIADKFCVKGEDGEYFSKSDEQTYHYNLKPETSGADFANAINELYCMECDIDPYHINPAILFDSNIQNDGFDIFDIDFLLED